MGYALDLFDLLSVEQCLVFGVESVGALWLAAGRGGLNCNLARHPAEVGRLSVHSGSVDTATGRPVKLLFVRHPSGFFSWRKWSPVVQEGLQWDFADDAPVRRN
jgi:hypothetical protein